MLLPFIIVDNNSDIKKKTKCRTLRNNSTAAEAVLWHRLKNKQIENLQWRRQYPIGRYILDFYCPAIKLCVELDGYHHYAYSGPKADELRNSFLNKCGINVLRFENKVIYYHLDDVIAIIRNECVKIISSL